ncbi:MAG: O-antigen ligase family protein, partial [Flavobacteriales bacterium]|nr:O-antigen ligase family protein [Flavobacteriales bacterium]
CVAVWMLYCFLELFNPLAPSILAWLYAVRGLALYGILLVPLIFLIYNKQKDCQTFIDIWFTASILLGLYGAKQFWFGLFAFEQAWLDDGGAVTHVLWGVFTRMFSFSSDANQFGSSQAHVMMIAIIFSIEDNSKRKWFYYITAAVSCYGMFISGTRGAIIIPIIGLAIYLVLSRNYRVLLLGSFVGGLLLYLLVFTFVLHSVEPIRRMRTAFSATKDESFNVRLENRANLDAFLSDKPFGGGIGSAGVWGKRFSPDNFLANFETDGQYVRIQAETGIVGLYLYYIIHLVMISNMLIIVWRLKTKKLRNIMSGFTCGVIALMVANYGAAVTVALPSSVIVLWSIAFVYMSPKWDRGEEYPVFGRTLLIKSNNKSI